VQLLEPLNDLFELIAEVIEKTIYALKILEKDKNSLESSLTALEAGCKILITD
jgi:hypothetical protein